MVLFFSVWGKSILGARAVGLGDGSMHAGVSAQDGPEALGHLLARTGSDTPYSIKRLFIGSFK